MRVGRDAENLDHHPEWSLSDGGKTVNVTLTSHFAQNTVTRLDFEMAEAMNNAYTETASTFRMFPWITDSQWSSIKIGTAMFVFGSFFVKFVTGTNYEQRDIAPAPLPGTHYESIYAKYSPVQALMDETVLIESIDFAYGEYESHDIERPIAGA